MKTFLSYWKPATADRIELGDSDNVMDHCASNQYHRLSPYDHIWLATVRKGKLSFLCRVVVGHVVDAEEAARLLGTSADSLWESDYHIIPANGTLTKPAEVHIPEIAKALRFEITKDRLNVKNDAVDPRQLQTMRELTINSADKLARAYEAAVAVRSRQSSG